MGVLRSLIEYLFGEVKYITDGYTVWEFTGRNLYPSPLDCERAIRVGSDAWVLLCFEIRTLRYYSIATGMCVLKREPPALYWRGYQWPGHKRAPARVYIGRLDRFTSEKLEAKMRRLRQKAKEKKALYLADKERKKRMKKRARQRVWRKRKYARK